MINFVPLFKNLNLILVSGKTSLCHYGTGSVRSEHPTIPDLPL